MIGKIDFHSYVNRTFEVPRYPWNEADDDPRPRCPYCLEPFSPETLETHQERVCPLCRHRIVLTLLGTPNHLFSRRQQWDFLANEIEYIWDWKYQIFVKVRDKEPGSLFEFQPEKDRFEALIDAKHYMRYRRESFLEETGDLESLMIESLKSPTVDDGGLSISLTYGRPWRTRARELSVKDAGFPEILEFQIGLIKETSWGAFGKNGEEGKQQRLLALEQKLYSDSGI